MTASEENPGAAAQMVQQEFPELASCVGSPQVKQKLNRSLRWAVDNELRILTPQVYVDGVRLCDEDVDLGMEFALSRMIQMSEQGTLKEKAREAEAESVPAGTVKEPTRRQMIIVRLIYARCLHGAARRPRRYVGRAGLRPTRFDGGLGR